MRLARGEGLLCLVLVGACASVGGSDRQLPQPAPPSATGSSGERATAAPSSTSDPALAANPRAPASRRTVCLTGAGGHRTFESFCESPLVVGRIDDCRNGPCHPTFSTFPMPNAESVWTAVFEALDTTHDGKLDDQDEVVELDVIGYSWGGVNAVDLAARMAKDERVATPWRVKRLILLDAFQPGASLSIPANVDKTFSFRHSVAPANDCSNNALLGPYLGIAPSCAASQACFDFDFSLGQEQHFGRQLATSVGHCDVPRAAMDAVKQLLRDEVPTKVPPRVPVKP